MGISKMFNLSGIRNAMIKENTDYKVGSTEANNRQINSMSSRQIHDWVFLNMSEVDEED